MGLSDICRTQSFGLMSSTDVVASTNSVRKSEGSPGGRKVASNWTPKPEARLAAVALQLS